MIRPLNNYIFVKLVKLEETTKSGIIIPSDVSESNESVMRGDIISSAVKEIKKGDRVLFKKYSPDVLVINQERFSIVAEKDILAKIENDEKELIKIEQDFEADTLQPSNPKFKKRYK
jgi:chaperonin GroES